METTRISATKTAGEIVQLLAEVGATQVNQEFKDGVLIGLRWTLVRAGVELPFAMPVRTEAVLAWGARYRKRFDQEQAERIAWRQLLRWTQAQMALIETGMVEAAEVFLPYKLSRGGQTFWEELVGRQFRALPAGSNK